MRILIVEDEPPIAADIEDYVAFFCGRNQNRITVLHTFEEARDFMEREKLDLLLLDLNLNGQNGFDILKETLVRNFHTIVVSAYTDRAIEAFEYGILDFVAKPIKRERMKLAFDRFYGRRKIEGKGLKYLIVRKMSQNFMVGIEQVRYFKAVGYLVEIHKIDGKTDLIEKSLNHLEQILPERFVRVHRSYIVDIGRVSSYRRLDSGVYEIAMSDGIKIPCSSTRLKTLSQFLTKG